MYSILCARLHPERLIVVHVGIGWHNWGAIQQIPVTLVSGNCGGMRGERGVPGANEPTHAVPSGW